MKAGSQRLRLSALRALLSLTPALPHAVVAGSPDDEGNSVEMARALAKHLRVYWLVGEEPASLWWLVADADGADNIRCLPRDSLRAFLSYLTARYIFFTHGLYGCPTPPPHKMIVNLWHGDGPKSRKGFANIHSSVIVAGTQQWGKRRPQIFQIPEESVLITGNPRVDQFDRPAGPAQLASLRLPEGRPLVLWMPTYRRTEYRGHRLGTMRNWADGQEISDSVQVRRFAEELAELADRLGITVAIKPHPLDADNYEATGLRVITRSELARARTTLYQLLGASSGLITDYSNVWTDYLCLDRPIGYYCPDLETYQVVRGLNVSDYRSLMAGPQLQSVQDVERFLWDCLHESAQSKAQRHRIADQIGARLGTGASQRLLDALGIASPRPVDHGIDEPRQHLATETAEGMTAPPGTSPSADRPSWR
jgi:hypothetical protein